MIEHLKRWHWCVLGILVGCIVASVSIWSGPHEKPGEDTIRHREFEEMLLYGRNFKGWTVDNVRNVQLHPPLLELYDQKKKANVLTDFISFDFTEYEVISFGLLVKEVPPNTPASGVLKPEDTITIVNGTAVQSDGQVKTALNAVPPNSEVKITLFRGGSEKQVVFKLGEKPYPAIETGSRSPVIRPRQKSGHILPLVVKEARPSLLGKDVEKMSATEYLQKLAEYMTKAKADTAKYPKAMELTWKKAFIDDPKMAYLIYGGGGFVVIGLIWPTILNFLVGAGFGRGKSDQKEVDLAKYKSKPEPKKEKATVTEDDMDQLKRLEAELEASLAKGASESAPASAGAATAVAAAPIKKLTATAVEPPKVDPKAVPHKDRDFGADQGDFYPTEVHGKKK